LQQAPSIRTILQFQTTPDAVRDAFPTPELRRYA
jgi:hypothetical protein